MSQSNRPMVLVTGATGFVGRSLIQQLEGPVVVASRNRIRALSSIGEHVHDVIEWNPEEGPLPLDPLLQVDTVINLMGESVDQRWTEASKRRIRESRVTGTRNLVRGLSKLEQKPLQFISASAVGFYGDHGEQEIDENAPPGDGFLSQLAVDWENEASAANDLGIQVAIVRLGLVMGKQGGIFKKLLPIFRWGAGGRLGTGKQWMPWIHLQDLVNLQLFIKQKRLSGVFNGTSPGPLTNLEFTRRFAKQLRRWAPFPVPAFALRIGLGEFGNSILESQRVIPNRAFQEGFEFKYADFDRAIENLLSS